MIECRATDEQVLLLSGDNANPPNLNLLERIAFLPTPKAGNSQTDHYDCLRFVCTIYHGYGLIDL